MASHYGNLKTIRTLEHFGADLFVKDFNNYTTIHYSASSGQIEALSYVCELATKE